MPAINLGTQPNTGAIKLGSAPTVKNPINPNPVNNGLLGSALKAAPGAIGVKTKNPSDNLITPSNKTNQPQTQKPLGGGKTTEGGTEDTSGVPLSKAQLQANTTKNNQANYGVPSSTTTPPVSNAPTPDSGTSPYYTPSNQGTNGVNQGGIIGDLITKATSTDPRFTQAYNTAQDYNKQLSDLKTQEADTSKNIEGTAGFMPQASGIQGIANRYFAAKEGAINSGYQGASNILGAINTQTGQGISALGSAASANSILGNTAYGLSPSSNQIVGGLGGAGTGQGVVNTALQLIKNGASIADAVTNSGLSAYGAVGMAALTNALQSGSGGSYNPTSLNTQVATNQATGAALQTQGVTLDTALKQITNLAPTITDFISKSGLNSSDSNLSNMPINEYIASLGNTGAASQAALMMSDLKSFASQLIAAKSGGTPTGTDALLNSIDPTYLNASQLQSYISTLADLGSGQLNVVQNQKNAAYGNNGGYSGSPGTPTPKQPLALPNRPAQGLTLNTAGEAAGGTLLKSAGGILSSAKNIGGEILGYILRGMI